MTTDSGPSAGQSTRNDAAGSRPGGATGAKARAEEAGSEFKEGMAGMASDAKEKAYSAADEGLGSAAGSIDDFAAAIGRASDELGQRDQSMVAGLMREAANGLQQASRSIKGQSVQDLTHSVAAFARRSPATFLVGAALAGVALGRFARSSGEHETDHGTGSTRSTGSTDFSSRAGTSPSGESFAGLTPNTYEGTSATEGTNATHESASSGLPTNPEPTTGRGSDTLTDEGGSNGR